MPHLAEKLIVKYSQKEQEYQRANAMKTRILRLMENHAVAQVANVSHEANQSEQQGANHLTDSLIESSTRGFAAECIRESMRKERLDRISDLVFKQYSMSEMITAIQTQIRTRKIYSSYQRCVAHSNLNNARTVVDFVIPSMVNAQDQNMILTCYLVMRYWQNLMNQQQKSRGNQLA